MDQPQPWRRLRERHLRDYRIFRTRTFDVADPRDGQEYVRTVLEGPDWVNVVPLTAEGEVVLIRQFRFGTWSNTLEIPGGMVDGDEAPDVAATRELEEETGFRPARLEATGWCHPNPAIQANRLFTYVAHGCVRVHAGRQEGSEDIRVELYPASELRNLVVRGEISHALVLAGLLLREWAAPRP